MLHALLTTSNNSTSIIINSKLLSYFKLIIIVYIVVFVFSSHSASISTNKNFSSSMFTVSFSHHSEPLLSHENLLIRRYFIDLLNISSNHSRLAKIEQQSSVTQMRQKRHRRRKRSIDDMSSVDSIFTLQSSGCTMINSQIQSSFTWSHSVRSLTSIELVYHFNSIESTSFSFRTSIPVRILLKQFESELVTINTHLQYDRTRDFYAVNIVDLFHQTNPVINNNNQTFTIESSLNELSFTCETSHTYLIVLSSPIHSIKSFSFDLAQLARISQRSADSSTCQLKTILIKFQELGLAHLIVRPKEYSFAYCDGSCSLSIVQQHSSMHAFFQSLANSKNPTIPKPTCVPSQFADDNFLLRQSDGNIELYPVKDVIVKQCTCR